MNPLDIYVPPHFSGEYRSVCPECSHTRRKSKDKCLCVDTDTGAYYCQHCGISGRLGSNVIQIKDYEKIQARKVQKKKDRTTQINSMWQSTILLDDEKAMAGQVYLSERGVGAIVHCLPSSVRFLERTFFYEDGIKRGPYSAVASLVIDKHGNRKGIHRICITQMGEKVRGNNKRSLGVEDGAMRGSFIPLRGTEDTVCLTEGVETGIAVQLGTGLPTYACISAVGLENVSLPERISNVNIMADKDHNKQGEDSAAILAERLLKEGRRVRIVLPPLDIPEKQKSVDWLDYYLEMEHEDA